MMRSLDLAIGVAWAKRAAASPMRGLRRAAQGSHTERLGVATVWPEDHGPAPDDPDDTGLRLAIWLADVAEEAATETRHKQASTRSVS